MRKFLIVALLIAARMASAQAYKPVPMLLYDSSGNPFPTGSGAALSFTPPAFTCYTIVTGSVVPCTFSGGGSGTVTTFSAGNLSPLFTTSVANPTTTPALTFTLSTASANTILAGPNTGAAAAPTFRILVAGDIPTGIPIANIGSAGLSGTSPITISSAGAIACPTCNTSSANVISVSGDGTIISNSASTGAVTLTLANTPTGTGSVVLATSPTLFTPALGTPSALVITNATGTCTACTANIAGSVTNALTLNNSNSGAASGTTYNGSAAVTLSANTLGAGSLANANSWSAAQTITVAGAASTANILDTGSVFTGGSTTTTTPHWLIQPASVTGGAIWSTSGTGLGMNFASGFGGNTIDIHVNNGASTFKTDGSGNLTVTGGLNGASITATGTLKGAKLASSTNCASGASPAVCGSAMSGSVAMPTGTNPTLVVNTTAVSAASEILITVDDSVTIGGTTCNSTLATLVGGMAVTARTAATSFTVSYNGTIAVNPVCFSYQIIN